MGGQSARTEGKGVRLQRLREILERNKIFFETVAVFLLSVMAITVASVQTWVAAKQTALMVLQTRVAETQVLPQFEILGFASNEGDASWELENKGAPIRDYVFEAACFLMITTQEGSVERRGLQLPPASACPPAATRSTANEPNCRSTSSVSLDIARHSTRPHENSPTLSPK